MIIIKNKLIAVILSLFIFVSSNIYVYADVIVEDSSVDLISSSEFDEDSVVVVFKENYSGINKVFTKDNFSETGVKNIEDLSRHVRDFIAEKKAEKLEALKLKNISSNNSNIASEITDEAIIEEYDFHGSGLCTCFFTALQNTLNLNFTKII